MSKINRIVLRPVGAYNRLQERNACFYCGNGSIENTPRKRGWVCTIEYAEGGRSNRFFPNREKASAFANSKDTRRCA